MSLQKQLELIPPLAFEFMPTRWMYFLSANCDLSEFASATQAVPNSHYSSLE